MTNQINITNPPRTLLFSKFRLKWSVGIDLSSCRFYLRIQFLASLQMHHVERLPVRKDTGKRIQSAYYKC